MWIETLQWHSETWKTLQCACVCLRLSLWIHCAAVSVFSGQNTRFRPHHLIPHQMKTSLPPHTHLGMSAIHIRYRKLRITHSAVFNAPLMCVAHREATLPALRVALAASAAEIWRLSVVTLSLNTQEGLKLGIRQSTIACWFTSLAPPISCEEYGSFREVYMIILKHNWKLDIYKRRSLACTCLIFS